MAERRFRVPPVVVFLATGALMMLAARAVPSAGLSIPGDRIAAGMFTAAGAAVALAGVIGLQRASTTVNPLRPETAGRLVVRGVYRISRNPVYLGMLLLTVAWSVRLANALAWAGVAVFFVVMDRYQIPHEERALRAAFGASFREYAARVRRWL